VAAETSKAIDELYSLPLDEFVARRDALARALRGEGERDAADEVKGLRKPSLAAWTVNQLARREEKAVGQLLEAGERLRSAHEKLLHGGSAEALQRASAAEREAVRTLTRAAECVLADAGLSTSWGTLERVRETLHAAALDPDVAKLVHAGRVTVDAEATGFGLELLGDAAAAPAARQPSAADERRAQRQRAAEERLAAARERLRDAREAVAEAERKVKEHSRALERAEQELRTHRTKLERAEREVERAR
jgi:chromosome segregation ATPase